MYKVKLMTVEDLTFAVSITDTMNWNLTEQDFSFMMQLEPQGCFVLLNDAEKIGIATTIGFGRVGWIGNVIIEERHRGKRAGSTIVKHAVNYLRSKGAETIGLYSYKDMVDFYARLGFKRNVEFTVLNGKAFHSPLDMDKVREAGENDVKKIVDFDRVYFGASREKLLTKIASAKGNPCYFYAENEEILGYAMAKVYDNFAELGPLTCKKDKTYVADNLAKAILNKIENYNVSVCLPKKEKDIINMLLNNGFKESFNVLRMFSGPVAFKDCIYIAESLERG